MLNYLFILDFDFQGTNENTQLAVAVEVHISYTEKCIIFWKEIQSLGEGIFSNKFKKNIFTV